MLMDAGFEEIEHTADVAIRVWGPDLPTLFAQAAMGMAHQLADPDTVRPDVEHRINLHASDVETLLVSWLGELLYLGERDGIAEAVFAKVDVHHVSPVHIVADVAGGPARQYRRAIKAVTFSDLAVRRIPGGYETVVVFDV
jgi:SHS2 domain-containing protein